MRQPGPTEFKIRPARRGDATALVDLANALGAATGGNGKAMSAEEIETSFLSGSYGLEVMVAELSGRIVAYALHSIGYETAYAERGRYVSDLYVAPSARRRGIARALLARISRLTAEEGGSFLWWVSKENLHEAKALYRSISDIEEPVTAFAATGETFRRLVEKDAGGR